MEERLKLVVFSHGCTLGSLIFFFSLIYIFSVLLMNIYCSCNKRTDPILECISFSDINNN